MRAALREGEGLVRARGGGPVPLVACLPPTYRTGFRAPATRAGRVERRADTHAKGPGGQAAGVARERASGGSGSRGGGRGGGRTSIWFQSMASQLPEPSISGEPRRWQRGGVRALVRVLPTASRGRGERESESRERWGKIKRRKEMCSLALFWSVRACPSVGLLRRRPDRARRALVAGVA